MTINATPISNTNRPQAYPGLAGFAMPPEILSSEICPNPNHRNAFRESGDPWPAIVPDALPSTKDAHLGRQVESHPQTSSFNLARIRRERLELPRIAGDLVGNKALADCGRYVVPGSAGVVLSYDAGKNAAGFRGVQHCNLPWLCAVDDARDRAARGAQLVEAAARIAGRGWYLAMITYTVQHVLGEAYAAVLDDLCAALVKTKRGTPWARIKAKHGILADVTVLEPLYSFDTGPHPHKHALVILDHKPTADELDLLQEKIGARFVTMAGKLGRRVSPTYGVTVTTGPNVAAYLAKWTAADELASSGKDSASCTPFDLLRRYAAGSAQAGAAFCDYAQAIKGRRRLVWSRGLKELLGMENWTPEEADQDAASPVLVLAGDQWAQVWKLQKRAELLAVTVATRGHAPSIWRYLVEVCRVTYDPDAAQERLERQTRLDARKSDKAQVRRQAAAKSALGALGDQL